MIFLIPSAFALVEYQEDPNASYYNDTDGTYSNYTLIIDGNYSSFATASFGEAILYINYTKPDNANITTVWQVRDVGTTTNLTIPQACWDLHTGVLDLRVRTHNGIPYSINWECDTGTYNQTLPIGGNTTYYTIRSYSAGGQNVYEEGVYWGCTGDSCEAEEEVVEELTITTEIASAISIIILILGIIIALLLALGVKLTGKNLEPIISAFALIIIIMLWLILFNLI